MTGLRWNTELMRQGQHLLEEYYQDGSPAERRDAVIGAHWCVLVCVCVFVCLRGEGGCKGSTSASVCHYVPQQAATTAPCCVLHALLPPKPSQVLAACVGRSSQLRSLSSP